MKKKNEQALGRVSLYPPSDLLEQLKNIAQKNHRSLNGEILEAIENHLKQEQATQQ
jgi:hypothetical protein